MIHKYLGDLDILDAAAGTVLASVSYRVTYDVADGVVYVYSVETAGSAADLWSPAGWEAERAITGQADFHDRLRRAAARKEAA